MWVNKYAKPFNKQYIKQPVKLSVCCYFYMYFWQNFKALEVKKRLLVFGYLISGELHTNGVYGIQRNIAEEEEGKNIRKKFKLSMVIKYF